MYAALLIKDNALSAMLYNYLIFWLRKMENESSSVLY